MAEIKTRIPIGQEQQLEALVDINQASDKAKTPAVIICHPHPLFGGNMYNNVVEAVRPVLAKRGYSTIRFNFRGVGGSGGHHGHGNAEIDDIKSVHQFAVNGGAAEVHLVGYSFGAWVALKAVSAGLRPATLTLISPPVDVLDFDELVCPALPCLVVTGEYDDYASPKSVERWLRERRERVSFSVLPRTDHFYGRRESLLVAKIESFFV